MLIPFGVLSAAGAEGVEPAFELISTEILGSTQSSFTFSGLGDYSSTYKHLQIRAVVRSDRANTDDTLLVRVNGDTGSNYRFHLLLADGSGVFSTGNTDTKMELGRTAGGSNASEIFGYNVLDVLDVYSTTKNKTFRASAGLNRVSGAYVFLNSGARFNTEAISSITLFPIGSFVSGSRFSIYGIKG
jgi:hypothetical protein